MRNFRLVALSIVLGLVILFADFFTKAYVYNLLPLFRSRNPASVQGISIFKDFLGGISFSLSLAINRGAAWGIFSDFQFLLLIIRMLVVLAMVVYLIFINYHTQILFPFVLIISGAVGNIIDFFLYGFVVDFFHFTFWGYDFPVFNIADTAITIGIAWLTLTTLFSKKTNEPFA